ncbi:hypothetical protein NBRC116588_01550 [Pyruvatibacter sp. HU-CL02332]
MGRNGFAGVEFNIREEPLVALEKRAGHERGEFHGSVYRRTGKSGQDKSRNNPYPRT